MAQNYGYFIKKEADGKTYYQGVLTLPQITGTVFLVPNDKRSDNAPDLTLKFRSGQGDVEHGAAWVKQMRTGAGMLSITIDAPHMTAPLYVSAFPDDHEEGRFNVVWSRPRAGSAARPVAAGADAGVPFNA